MFAFTRNAAARRSEILSAYLDGVLSPAERARVEALLARSADARRELETLRATVAILRAAPYAAAPRSFALTPVMLRRPASPSTPHPNQWLGPRLLLPIASATALAFLAFTLIGGSLDLFTHSGAPATQPDSTTAFQDSIAQRPLATAAPAPTGRPAPLAAATARPSTAPVADAFAPSASGPQSITGVRGATGAPAIGGAQTEAINSAAAPSPDASLKSLEAILSQPATENFPWLALQLTAAALTAAAAIALAWRWRTRRSSP
ncbi:MAG: hypothetical protein EXR49_09370 [Dehalococcoidia bacterium]|nr:hypothetical protein [Dehalococcoidia bacterium]